MKIIQGFIYLWVFVCLFESKEYDVFLRIKKTYSSALVEDNIHRNVILFHSRLAIHNPPRTLFLIQDRNRSSWL
jgi:hypothetical protein